MGIVGVHGVLSREGRLASFAESSCCRHIVTNRCSQASGVVGREVNFVLAPIQREADRLVGAATIEIIEQLHNAPLHHSLMVHRGLEKWYFPGVYISSQY